MSMFDEDDPRYSRSPRTVVVMRDGTRREVFLGHAHGLIRTGRATWPIWSSVRVDEDDHLGNSLSSSRHPIRDMTMEEVREAYRDGNPGIDVWRAHVLATVEARVAARVARETKAPIESVVRRIRL